MSPPILAIYPDLWLEIAPFLNTTSIYRLLTTGCPQLRSTLIRRVRHFVFHDRRGILDIESLLGFCSEMKFLEWLSINQLEMVNAYSTIQYPQVWPMNWPSTLVRLHLRFQDSFSLVQAIDLPVTFPKLLDLSIRGHQNGFNARLSEFRLPPLLESLTFLPGDGSESSSLPSDSNGVFLSEADIDTLPRTLVNLNIRWDWATTNDLTRYVWPLSLRSCTLHSASSSLLIEHMPRTVTELDIRGMKDVHTLYEGGSNPVSIQFPWRVFFPHLLSLYLRKGDWRVTSNDSIPSIVNLNHDLESALLFISSGFWNLPSHLMVNKNAPSNYIVASFRQNNYWSVKKRWGFQYEILSPLVEGSAVTPPSYVNTRMLPYVLNSDGKPSITAEGSENGENTASPACFKLYTILYTTEPRISGHLMACHRTFTNRRPSGEGLEGLLPPPPALCSNFLRVTHLFMSLKGSEAWDMLAGSLPALESLRLQLLPCWRHNPSTYSATPMQNRLKKVVFEFPYHSIYQLWNAVELIFKTGVFPSSLTSLEVPTARATLFSALPPNLRQLKIQNMRPVRYSRQDVKNFQFECLPQNLRCFEALSYANLPTAAMLQNLPASLTSLSISITYGDLVQDLQHLKSRGLSKCIINSNPDILLAL